VANLAKCDDARTPTLDKICTLTHAYLKVHTQPKKTRRAG
jgi:hypothetical protein